MTEILIPLNDAWVQYTAAGGETEFAYDFPIFDEAHVVIIETDTGGADTTLVKDTDYTVDGVGVLAGGNLTLDPTLYPSGATAGYVYTIYRDVPEARATDFTQLGDFTAFSINRELDLMQMQVQQLRRDLDRAAVLPVTVAGVSAALPEPEASKVLAWNSGATALENVTGGGGAVDSVNGQTGVVVLDPDDLDDSATTNKFTTAAEIAKLAGIEASATADQTGAEIKALYEAEADTNAYDDAAVSKLAGIEANATADQSAAEILAALLTVDGSGSGLDADLLDGLSAAAFATAGHNHSGDYQPLDSDLTALAAISGTRGDVLYYGAAGWAALGVGSAGQFLKTQGAGADPIWDTIAGGGDLLAANNLSDVANAATSLSNLGGQPSDAELTAIAGLVSAADRLPYFTGSGTAALATFTSAGRALVDDASASAQRTTLGLGSLATLSTINNSNWSGTDLALTNGGTGASSQGAAFTNVVAPGGTMTGAVNFADQNLQRPNVVDYSVESTSPSISAGTLTLNLTNGNDFDVTWNANITTLTVSNWPASGTFGKLTLRLAMDGTTRTISWPASWNWPAGTAPTSPSINQDIEIVAWTRDGGTNVQAVEIGQAFA